jgi:hypothetical protein
LCLTSGLCSDALARAQFGLPPFRWPAGSGVTHIGEPELYNFSFVVAAPAL